MEPHTILLYLGCLPSVIAIVVSVVSIDRKKRAREALLGKLVHDSDFVSEVQHSRDARVSDQRMLREVDERITALILKQLKKLDLADRLRVETGLYQPSRIGRERYAGKLIEDAELQLGTLFEAETVMLRSE